MLTPWRSTGSSEVPPWRVLLGICSGGMRRSCDSCDRMAASEGRRCAGCRFAVLGLAMAGSMGLEIRRLLPSWRQTSSQPEARTATATITAAIAVPAHKLRLWMALRASSWPPSMAAPSQTSSCYPEVKEDSGLQHARQDPCELSSTSCVEGKPRQHRISS